MDTHQLNELVDFLGDHVEALDYAALFAARIEENLRTAKHNVSTGATSECTKDEIEFVLNDAQALVEGISDLANSVRLMVSAFAGPIDEV